MGMLSTDKRVGVASTESTPYGFLKKFSKVAAAKLTIAPLSGAAPFEVERDLSKKHGVVKTLAAGKATGQLAMDGVDTAYLRVAGGFRGDKMYYLYVFVAGTYAFLPLTATEYNALTSSKVTLALTFPVKPASTPPVADPVPEVEVVTAEHLANLEGALSFLAEVEVAPESKRAARRSRRGVVAA